MPRHQQTATTSNSNHHHSDEQLKFQKVCKGHFNPALKEHTAPQWCVDALTTYKCGVPVLQRAGALLPPGTPQQETQQIQHKHGGLGEGAEEGLVVFLLLENVLKVESTGGSS